MRFDGRVAVITGAGRGLGKAYAELLAARGAKVLINDPGVSLQGEAGDQAPADALAGQIAAAGGEALANTDSVATEAGGQSIIDSAINTWGRVDILIHNAGIVRRGSLKELAYEDFQSVLDVHLRGGYHVLRAAFPHMCDAGYGRVVMTGSINGLYGNAGVAGYCAAKGGLMALSNVAALEGAEYGVYSNVIIPGAFTRMAEGLDTSAYPPMQPELVAPAVGYLAHENCKINGEMLVSIAGRIARAYSAESRGVYRPDWTIESVAEQIDNIRDSKDGPVFAPAPSGQMEHLKYSFEMASAGK